MQPSGDYADDLVLAMRIADQVDRLTMRHFEIGDIAVDVKPDSTPVTAVDRGAEQLIRDYLDTHRRPDAVYGEEFGSKGGGPRQWVIDPVDGTKNYVRGVPIWATLIALLDEGQPVLGVVSAPALHVRWFAAQGAGAWKGTTFKRATRIGVSGVSRLEEASLSYSSLSGWENRGMLDVFLDLTRAVWRTRAYGDFLSYMMLAEGSVDIATEPELELYDMAALVPIVEEAGGRFTSIAGTNGPFGGDALATNGLLQEDVLGLLHSAGSVTKH